MQKTKPRIWFIRVMAVVISLGAIAAFAPWDVGYAYFAPLPETVQAEVEAAAGSGLDGVIVYVDQGGQSPAFYSAGWKDKAAKIPADPHALFKIASLSKLYIAVATTRLVHEKRLSLDATLTQLLPELDGRIDHADEITLRMLLQHRSGIPNFTDDREFEWGKSLNAAQALSLILDDPADFKPNSRYRYSNTNYLLIGDILDKTLGYSHRDYIKAEILTPLGLNHTYGLYSEVDPARVASGYVIGYEGDLKSLDYVMPGGSMVATAQEVGVFMRALNTSTLLDADEQALYASLYEYDHTGLLPGYQSFAHYHKDIDAVIIVFVNTSGGKTWAKSEGLSQRVARILRKQKKAQAHH